MVRNNEHYKDILKMFEKLTYSHDTWSVFNDWLELTATCISNAADKRYFDEREKMYLGTIKKYSPEHQQLFPEMFAKLVLALEHEYNTSGFVDVLGRLFHELELHNKWKGQFFTPQHICEMMGKMLLDKNDKTIEEQGFIAVYEPACGSGAMICGFAQAAKDCNYNHSEQILVKAVDIDLKCVHMTYIQLALYGIPAVVTHGNSLSMEEWSHWFTPVYIFGGWGWRRQRKVEVQGDVIEEIQENGEIQEIVASQDSVASQESAANAEQTLNDAQTEEPQQKTVRAEIVLPTQKEAIQTYEQLDLFSIFKEGE